MGAESTVQDPCARGELYLLSEDSCVCLYRGTRVWSLEAHNRKCKLFNVLLNMFVVWGHRGTRGQKCVPVERHTLVYQGPEQGSTRTQIRRPTEAQSLLPGSADNGENIYQDVPGQRRRA